MVTVKNLVKSFGAVAVLRELSVEVTTGEVVAILGSSGSGKSTFLRCLNYLDAPDSGDISIAGVIITPQNQAQIRSQIGMVFQNFNLFPHFTVLKNLTYAPVHVKKMSTHSAERQAQKLLHQVGLSDKSTSYPETLSGGQKQRVAIARALMMDPKLILFDEPTSALDPEMTQEVLRVIQGLASSHITMLIATHEMGFVQEVSSRVLFLEGGKILEDRPTPEFFSRHRYDRISQFLRLADPKRL